MISSANKQATKMVHVERVDRLNVSLFLLFQFSDEHVSKMRLFGLCACVRACVRVHVCACEHDMCVFVCACVCVCVCVCVYVCSGKQTG